MKKVNPIRIKFYEFLNDDIGKNEFQQWMYSAKELENEFPEDHYVDLISFPYKTGEAKEYITKIITTFFDYKEYELWRTINLLEDISKGEIEIISAADSKAELGMTDDVETDYMERRKETSDYIEECEEELKKDKKPNKMKNGVSWEFCVLF